MKERDNRCSCFLFGRKVLNLCLQFLNVQHNERFRSHFVTSFFLHGVFALNQLTAHFLHHVCVILNTIPNSSFSFSCLATYAVFTALCSTCKFTSLVAV